MPKVINVVDLKRLGCGHSCGKKATPGANGPPVQGKGCLTAARTPPGVAEAAPRRGPALMRGVRDAAATQMSISSRHQLRSAQAYAADLQQKVRVRCIYVQAKSPHDE